MAKKSIKPIISKSGQTISVMWFDKRVIQNRAVAEATEMGDHWYVNRVLVQPKEMRSKGIGSLLLQTLVKEIRKDSTKRIIVTPGGYATELEKQQNFYKKNGFVIDKENSLITFEPMYYKDKQ
jgi:GNAT superfamily N-acetyltransferase